MIPNYQGFGDDLFHGALVTIQLALASGIGGVAIGLLLCAGKISRFSPLRFICFGIANIFRGLPELLVILLAYFGLQSILNEHYEGSISINPFVAGILALSLISGAYTSEVFRAAYHAVNKGQIEAAVSYGMNSYRTFVSIRGPQMLRISLPSLGNLWLLLLKDTSLVAVISLNELMRQAQIATATTKDPFLFYGTAAIIYIIISIITTKAIDQYGKGRAL
ncbi:MAG: ABC transporter permease subunit [Halomonas sp.]|uniref:ABC transporter permease subunit n=1 Tax=Halomonas sp. TaxID=1486246 RepID=UPI003F9073DB